MYIDNPSILEAMGMSSINWSCPCCGKLWVHYRTVTAAMEINRALGPVADDMLMITSGYRCIYHNAQIGGVPDSAHTKGLAFDAMPNGLESLWTVGMLATLTGAKVLLNYATGSIHVEPFGSIGLRLRLNDGQYYNICSPSVVAQLRGPKKNDS